MKFSIDELLARALSVPASQEIFRYDDRMMKCLDENLREFEWARWDEHTLAPFTARLFYKLSDRHEKYGQEYMVVYFNDQPAYIVSRSGRYLVNYTKYEIDPTVAMAIRTWFKQEQLRIEIANGTHIEDTTIEELLASTDFMNMNLEELPIDRNDMYSPRDAILDLAR